MKCRRTVCQNDQQGCQHSQTGEFYCEDCARKINKNNPEVPNLVGIPRTMRPIKVTFDDGDFLTTNINGSAREIEGHYIGQKFEGAKDTDPLKTAVKVEFL